jgi:DNA helicase II / ATP-dependent DNA helicase PcrA
MSSVIKLDPDTDADQQILDCVKKDTPRSFFLFAGAGSGKTRSLVNLLREFQRNLRDKLLRNGHRIAVITYTNAASDVISRRLEYDPFIHVSTIHSFAWSLIGGFHEDMRNWLRARLSADIAELEATLQKTRAGTKVRVERESSLSEKRARLESLNAIRAFTYSPTGENSGRDSLNHSEVVDICTSFLGKRTLQMILTGRFPYLFIDESQDTNKDLIDGFFAVQVANSERFCLGLFGDMMQRIYSDGKVGLANAIPADWAKPEKHMNWRSPKRVVRLINEIRRPVDGLEQQSPEDKAEGFARCYIYNSNVQEKPAIEAAVHQKMAAATGDQDWLKPELCKALTLEHHMAAGRLGFSDFFMPLYQNSGLRTGLINRQLSGLPLFFDSIIPIVKAIEQEDKFEIARVLRSHSPLLQRRKLARAGEAKVNVMETARAAVTELSNVLGRQDVRAMDVLRCVSRTGVFDIPETLRTVLLADEAGLGEAQDDSEIAAGGVVRAWYKALQAPFVQVRLMVDYLSDTAKFDTHQGVKGREFPRVMVIMDPEAERGFMFNYDKLFEVSAKSKTDLEHEAKGEETTIDRTRRLFYVTCSRAEGSLALVIYTSQPDVAQNFFVAKNWFAEDEIEVGG